MRTKLAFISFVMCVASAFSAWGQSWQSIGQSGSSIPSSTVWTQGVYDPQHNMLLVTQDDPGANTGIYADTVYSFDPTKGLWSQLFVSNTPNTQCPGDAAGQPNHRHTYDQITWDTFRNQMYITSGSCQGALDYDWFAFTHTGAAGSGAWTQFPVTSPNPGNRQEGAMVYMPTTDRVMLYGGFSGANGGTSDDTWEYNPANNTWTMICTGCGPQPRHGHTLVFDPPSGKVILWGGSTCFNACPNLNLTYLYDPMTHTWSKASPAVEPPAAIYPCHGYDQQRNRLLVYAQTGQLWQYTSNNNTWVQTGVSATGAPPSDPGLGDGPADTFCGYDVAHDFFVYFSAPGLSGGSAKSLGVSFGHPPSLGTPLPTIALTAPSGGASVSGTVNVTATVTDSAPVSQVQFQLDGANLGAPVTTPPYQTTWDTTKNSDGQHQLTAVATDPNGMFSTSTRSVTVANNQPAPGFSLSASSSSATVNAGQTATYTLTIAASNGFNQAVALACMGGPTGSNCTVSPNSVTPNGSNATATVTVTTTARGAALPSSRGYWHPPAGPVVLLGCLASALLALALKGRLRLASPALALMMLGIGCGGGSTGAASGTPGTPGTPPTGGTPAGTFTVTVTGTSGAQSHATPLTLIVN